MATTGAPAAAAAGSEDEDQARMDAIVENLQTRDAYALIPPPSLLPLSAALD